MSSILAVARAHLRGHRVAILAVGVLAGVFGAAILGAIAGAQRTATAYDRLLEATKIDDVRVAVYDPGLAEKVPTLPQVERAWSAGVLIGQLEGDQVIYLASIAGPPRPSGLFEPIVIAGRQANPAAPNEVVLVEEFVRRTGLGLGDRLVLDLITKDEFTKFDVGFGEPDGPRLTLDVVGVVRAPDAGEGIVNVIGTPALAARLERTDSVVGRVVLAHLREGPRQVEEFVDALSAEAAGVPQPLGAEEFQPFEFSVPSAGRETARASAGVLTLALLAIAFVVLIAAGFVIVQSAARRHDAGSPDQFVEGVLGMTRTERAIGRAIGASAAPCIAVVIAVAGAILSSRWTPAGIIASYEPQPGVRFDLVTMGLGGLAIGALVLVAEFVTALRAGRTRSHAPSTRPSWVAERAASAGLPAAIVVGLRNAFERHSRDGRVPTRSALIATTVGLAGVVAVGVFTGSLARLSDTPERYGWRGDLLWVDLRPEDKATLERDDRVGELSVVQGGAARTTSNRVVTVYSVEQVRGNLTWSMLRGHAPQSPNEVAVGPRLARELEIDVGDTIAFEDQRERPTATAIVVGVGLGPQTNSEPLGSNLLVHPRAFATISNTEPFTGGYVKASPAVDGAGLAEDLGAEAEVVPREKPPEVTNLENLGSMPGLLGILLGLTGLAAVANALLVGSARRRVDTGILKAIGSTAREVRTVVIVAAIASTTVAIGLGTPLGIGIGSGVWGVVARLTQVGDDPSVTPAGVGLVAGAAVVLTVLVAAVPAARAARTRAADALRAE